MDTDSHGRILLPSKTIIKMFDEESYRSIRGKNTLEGILLPWNLRTTWKRGNNSLFYIVAFNIGIHPEPLLMDLLESLGSRMVVEDQRSTERVISRISRTLRISEPYNDGTTSISDRKPQFASLKFERPFGFKSTTKTTHYPWKNGTPKWINSETWKLFKRNSRMETNTETIRTSQDEETLYLRDRQSNTCLTDLTGDQTFNSKPLLSTTKPQL